MVLDSRLTPERIRLELRARGLRWTPQRRAILAVLRETSGHVTATELIEQCRRLNPDVTPSTVYRTLATLEDLGLVVHNHGPDGREEYHVGAETEHAHLACERCGQSWELETSEVRRFVGELSRSRDFEVDLSHLTVVGRCRDCRGEPEVAVVGRRAGGATPQDGRRMPPTSSAAQRTMPVRGGRQERVARG